MKKFKIKIWRKIPKELKNQYSNEKYNPNDYMKLFIFETYEEMYNTVDKIEKSKVARDYKARCWCFTHIYQDIETLERTYAPLCGNLYFVKKHMGAGTVSHECSHATIGYFNRKIKDYNKIFEKLDFSNEDISESCMEHEELFCYMLGSLVNQIYSCYYKVGD